MLRYRTQFLGPPVAFYVALFLVPLFCVVLLAFTSWSGFAIDQIHWVGLANFRQLVHDSVFREALLHTVLYVAVTVTVLNAVGLGLALLIQSSVFGGNVLRIAMFLPLSISPVISGLIWQKFLGPFGFVDHEMLALGLPAYSFFSPGHALGTVILVSVWLFAGFNTLLYLAGLQTLPRERLEAAAIDGANLWNKIRWVVLPHLRPIVVTAVVFNLIGGWKVFDIVFVLTDGGPFHRSEVLSTYLYSEAFTQDKMGYASAIGVVIFFLSLISAIVVLRLGDRRR